MSQKKGLVTDDETSSLSMATKLCDSRKKYEENYKKKMTEEAQKNQGSQQGSGSSGEGELSFAAKMQGRYDSDTIMDSIINYVSYEGIPYLQNEVLQEGDICHHQQQEVCRSENK